MSFDAGLMPKLFLYIITAFLILLMITAIAIFRGRTSYDKLNALFLMSNLVIIILALLGYTDLRSDMYIDIALSYAILSFVSSVILAKYIGAGRNKK